MADYNKLTVVQIRELFKTRNIPTTGLTRKQQLIDRLLDEDAAAASQDAANDDDTSAAPEAASDAPAIAASVAAANDAQSANNTDQVTIAKPQDSTFLSSDAIDNNAPPEMSVPDKVQEAGPPDYSPKQIEADEPQTIEPGSKSTTASPPPPPPPPEESRKRKRRSASPPISEEDILQKKAKQEEGGPSVVLKEDLQPLDTLNQTAAVDIGPAEEFDGNKAELISEINDAFAAKESSKEDEGERGTSTAPNEPQMLETAKAKLDGAAVSALVSPAAPTKLPQGREKLYKELVSSSSDTGGQATMDEGDKVPQSSDERDISPALHPATTALYIRDFMRPLRPEALEAHLKSLAQSARKQTGAQEEEEGLIRNFHLDAIRTHCLVVFSSVLAASRVRSAMHERVWPPEGNRKPLWADFVPEDKVQEWIEREQDGGTTMRGAGSKRWEVVYHRLEDGMVTTTLEEASAAPYGPRRSATQGSNAPVVAAGPPPPARREPFTAHARAEAAPASFAALDSLFKSTSAKPKLYFMPVSKERAEKRLDELKALTSKHNVIPPGGSGYADSRRYTFENGDVLVDNGPEFGLRQLRPPPRAYRGGR